MKVGEAFLEFMPKLDTAFTGRISGEASKAGVVAGKALGTTFSKAVETDVNNKMTVVAKDAGKILSDGLGKGLDDAVKKIAPTAKDAGTKWANGFKEHAKIDIGLDALITKFFISGATAGKRFKTAFTDENKTFNIESFNNIIKSLAAIQAKAAIAGTALASMAPQVAAVGVAAAPAVLSLAAMRLGMLAVTKVASAVLKLAMKDVGEAINVAFNPDAKPEELKAAMDKLTPSARAVVGELSGIGPKLKEVQQLTQEGLFKPLIGTLGPLTERFLPLAKQQLPGIASAMGEVGKSAAKAAAEGSLFGGVNSLLENTKHAIMGAGAAAPSLINAFGNVVRVLTPGLGGVGQKIGEIGTKFGEFISKIANDGTLSRWVATGNATLKDFGGLLKNVLTIIFTVFKESNVQGTNLIQVLRDVTGQVAKFVTSAKGVDAIRSTFAAMSAVAGALKTGLGAVLPAIAASLVAAAPAVAGLATSFANLIVAIAPLLPFAVGLTAQLVKALTPAIEKLTGFLAENQNIMKALLVVMAAYTAAAKVQAAVIAVQAAGGLVAYIKNLNLVKGATTLWTGVQWLLNAALTANPIGIVVVALGALVAAIVLAYKNSETFRDIVNKAWAAIKTAAQDAWEKVLKPAFEGIVTAGKKAGEFFTWLWKNAVVPAWNGIKSATDTTWNALKTVWSGIDTSIKAVGKVFDWLWKNAIEPAWKGIKAVIEANWTAVKTIFSGVDAAVKAVGAVFTALWNNTIKPAWEGIKNTIQAAWNFIKGTVLDAASTYIKGPFTQAWNALKSTLTTIWDGIKSAIQAAWNAIKSSVLDPASAFVKGTFTQTWNTLKSTLTTIWDGIKSAIQAAWNFIKGSVLDPASAYIKGAFTQTWNTLKATLTTIWDGIKSMFQAAWNWIKSNVFDPWMNFINSTVKAHWESFKTFLTTTWDAIKSMFKAAWDWIKTNVFDPWMAFINGTVKTFWTTFKTFLTTTWDAIKAMFKAAYDWIKTNVFDAWMNFVNTTVKTFWNTFKTFLTDWWTAVKNMFKAAYDWIKTNVFDAWINFVNTTVKTFWNTFKTFLTDWWTATKNLFKAAYDWIKTNVFEAWTTYVNTTVKNFWNAFKTFLTTLWNDLKNMLKSAWEWVRDNVFKAMQTYITGSLQNSWDSAKKGIIDKWNAIKQPLQDAFNWVKSNVFDKMVSLITQTIPNAFATGVSAIKSAWDKVKAAASEPVKFVVNTVLNDGLIKGFNWISSKVGGPTIPNISLGFASGGVLPGYTPGRDVHKFVGPAGNLELSGGEAIMRPEFTRAVGTKFVDQVNATARQKGVRGVEEMLGGPTYAYAGGGIWDKVSGAVSSAWDALTNPIGTFKQAIVGAIGSIGGTGYMKDVLGKTVTRLIDGAVSFLTPKWETHKAAEEAKRAEAAAAAQLGGGGSADGWKQMKTIIQAAVGGTNITSAFRQGDPGYHGKGRAIDMTFSDGSERRGGGKANQAFNHIASQYGAKTKELIWDFSPWGRSLGIWNGSRHTFSSATSGPGTHNDHIHWAMKNGGVFKYDDGGMLNPGQIGINRLRQPEAVLTPEETKGLKNLGTDELMSKLDELIDAVNRVGPNVGNTIGSVGRSLINKSRGV